MASRDQDAVVRCAAMRAQQVLQQASGAFAMLVSQMGDLHFDPDRDQINRWCTVIFWLNSVLEDEVDNLNDSLEHDHLVAQTEKS